MEWLVSTDLAQQLLEVFEIKVIPMLNPDGVRKGNHRFSFAGTDLNRKWKTPGQRLHPEIYHVRNYIH
jgi:murein tripeptide amidase MpaA